MPRADLEFLLGLSLLYGLSPRRGRDVRQSYEATGRLPAHWPPADAVAAARRSIEAKGQRFLTPEDPLFPAELLAIPDPPQFLFVRGRDQLLLQRPRVAVVGARAASPAGREIARTIGRDLALSGVVVVSGLARGIDGQAHRGALDAGGSTIAVLGAGLDVCYPPEHGDLFEAIGEKGLLASEFPPGAPPFSLHFPRRNRILSGLADLLVVVEGSERSGARSTVDHALDQGRDVWAVPRDILHVGSALPNRLLRDGARPLINTGELIADLRRMPLPTGAGGGTCLAHPDLGSRLLSCLAGGPLLLDELCRGVQAAPEAVQAELLDLEVGGVVTRLPGGRYRAEPQGAGSCAKGGG